VCAGWRGWVTEFAGVNIVCIRWNGLDFSGVQRIGSQKVKTGI
jgi:hypothetical protein